VGVSDEETDVFGEIERRIESVLGEICSRDEEDLFDLVSGSLKPLDRIEITPGEVIVTFDLPYVEKKDISLVATEETLRIDAKMTKPVLLRVGGSMQKRVEFVKYSKKISLPTKVDPRAGKARFRGGILIVNFPVVSKGNTVAVDEKLPRLICRPSPTLHHGTRPGLAPVWV
jgi:HSP20 family molecular chaperone IbpA